jgi:uncharacterized membrane protein YhaH (DUF805 family)
MLIHGIGVSMMTIGLFLSFSARISRAQYWLATVTLYALMSGLFAVFTDAHARISRVFLAAAGVMFLAICYSKLSISAKRFHDRGKSGWAALFLFAPAPILIASELLQNELLGLLGKMFSLGIEIWFLVELGFLRGDVGPNRFGPDPLARHSPTTHAES